MKTYVYASCPTLSWAVSALALAGCGGSTATALLVVDTVSVDPAEASLETVASTTEFTAVALDRSGEEVPGVIFLWSSSDEAVATIDADGLAIATGTGSAVIQATMPGVTGSATIVVGPAASASPGR